MTAPPGPTGSPLPLARLTSLRAVAALAVFVFHLGRWDVLPFQPLPHGYTGVGFFFVLSGFVLAWSVPPQGVRSVGTFYRRRLARIYPLHLVTLTVALLLPVTANPVDRAALLPNLVLLQAWSPDPAVAFGVNGVSWSLSCEIAFYAVLPFLLPPLRRMPGRVRWAVAAAVALACAAATVSLSLLGGTAPLVAYANPAVRLGEFVLGVVAALAVREGWRMRRRVAWAVGAPSLAAVALLPLPWPSADAFAAPAFVVVVVMAAQADLVARPGLLTRPWAVYAGEVSFAFYLCHELVLLNLARPWEATGLPTALLAVPALAVSVLVAAVLHHVVEVPARRALLRARPGSAVPPGGAPERTHA